MPYNEEISSRIYRLLRKREGLTGKKMFGGFAYLLHGNLCCGVRDNYIILRVGPDAYQQFLQSPYTREFAPTGRVMRGWVVVEQEGFEGEDDLSRLITQAVEFTLSLPPKDNT